MSSATLGSTARESASAYDRWASDYDHCENKTRDLDGIALRAQDLDMAGKEVVEFGCGTGRHTMHFLDKFGEHIVKYTAMDASEVIDTFFFSQFEMACYVNLCVFHTLVCFDLFRGSCQVSWQFFHKQLDQRNLFSIPVSRILARQRSTFLASGLTHLCNLEHLLT